MVGARNPHIAEPEGRRGAIIPHSSTLFLLLSPDTEIVANSTTLCSVTDYN